jgi:hypothetical protein
MKKLTLAQKLKNPATRSKVPTSQLPAKYQKMRALNQRLAARDDPNALTAPLTPRTLDQQVTANTNLQFGDSERDLQQRQQQAQALQTSIPQWFQDYQNALQHATDQTKQVYAAAAAGQQNMTNSTYGLDTAAAAQQQQAMQADAAIRGTTVDPKIAAEAQQAALSRRSAGDIQTNLTLGLGATQASYRAGQQGVAAAQKLQAQTDQASRVAALGQESKSLAAKKGDYATTTRQKLIDSEHTKQLENKAFNLNQQKAADDTAIRTAGLKLDAKGLQLKQDVADATQALNEAKLTNDTAKIQIAQQNADTAKQRADAYATKQASTAKTAKASQGAARKDIDYAMTQIKQLRSHLGAHKVPAKDSKGNIIPNKFVTELDKNGNPVTKGGRPPTEGQIRAALQNGEGPLRPVPNAAINAALRLLDPMGGNLSPAQITQLRATYPGVRILELGYPTGKPGRHLKRKRIPVHPNP